jgi:hypothetical protein
MKNKKMNLESLKVTSFVTSLAEKNQHTLKGGVTDTCGASFDACPSVPVNNCNVASYNQTCPTLPLQQCNVNINLSRVRTICENIYYTDVPALGC